MQQWDGAFWYFDFKSMAAVWKCSESMSRRFGVRKWWWWMIQIIIFGGTWFTYYLHRHRYIWYLSHVPWLKHDWLVGVPYHYLVITFEVQKNRVCSLHLNSPDDDRWPAGLLVLVRTFWPPELHWPLANTIYAVAASGDLLSRVYQSIVAAAPIYPTDSLHSFLLYFT